MEWRIGSYETARPIVDRSRRRFHAIERLVAWRAEPDALHLRLATRGGKDAFARITFADPEVMRLQWSISGEPPEHCTEMLDGAPPRLPLDVEESEGRLYVHAGGTRAVLQAQPWRVEFGPYAGEKLRDASLEIVDSTLE